MDNKKESLWWKIRRENLKNNSSLQELSIDKKIKLDEERRRLKYQTNSNNRYRNMLNKKNCFENKEKINDIKKECESNTYVSSVHKYAIDFSNFTHPHKP